MLRVQTPRFCSGRLQADEVVAGAKAVGVTEAGNQNPKSAVYLSAELSLPAVAGRAFRLLAQSAETTRAAAVAGVKVKVQGCSARGQDRVPTRGIF